MLHGPLVRAIGGFSHLTFDFQTARELLNINLAEAGEIQLPQDNQTPVLPGDGFTNHNLPLIPGDVVDGEKNLRQFNEFCLRGCGRQCATAQVFSEKARPPAQSRVTARMIQERDYPGFCLYFWVLRSLLDLSRLAKTAITSVVEDISAPTEMTRFVLPSLLAIPRARQQIEHSGLGAALQATGIKYPTDPSFDVIFMHDEKHHREIEIVRFKSIFLSCVEKTDRRHRGSHGSHQYLIGKGYHQTEVRCHTSRRDSTTVFDDFRPF